MVLGLVVWGDTSEGGPVISKSREAVGGAGAQVGKHYQECSLQARVLVSKQASTGSSWRCWWASTGCC